MGFTSLEDSVRFLEGYFRRRDANDLLAMLWTWQHADISANKSYRGDFAAALGAIKARAIVMPGETDLYFRVRDNELEVEQMPHGELRPIPSIWGHVAGLGVNPSDNALIDAALHELLAVWLCACPKGQSVSVCPAPARWLTIACRRRRTASAPLPLPTAPDAERSP